jgi:hypothetical protein
MIVMMLVNWEDVMRRLRGGRVFFESVKILLTPTFETSSLITIQKLSSENNKKSEKKQ